MLQGLDDAQVRVRQAGVLAHHSDVNLFLDIVNAVCHRLPLSKQRTFCDHLKAEAFG